MVCLLNVTISARHPVEYLHLAQKDRHFAHTPLQNRLKNDRLKKICAKYTTSYC